MLSELETKIQYQFKDQGLLEKALSHKSQANEKRHLGENKETLHNERLEFLGDAVLQLVISDILWDRFRESDEGKLSKMRSSLVNEASLAEIARSIDLGQHLLLGKGEINTGGRNKNSILACGYEALLGAIYLEGGLKSAFTTIEAHFKERILVAESHAFTQDFKSLLQEKVQGDFRRAPIYKVQREEGPDHDKTFEIVVAVGRLMASGTGRNKKEAEQSAAKALLELLDGSDFVLDKEEVGIGNV